MSASPETQTSLSAKTGKVQKTYRFWLFLLMFLLGQGLLVVFADTARVFFRGQSSWQRDEGIERLKQTVATEPENPENQVRLGEAYFRSGRYSEALTHFRAAIEFDDSYLPAYMSAGHVFWAVGQKEDALASFQFAKDLSPKDYRSYLYSGIVLRELGRYADSASELEKARALEPSGSDIYVQLGLTYGAWGKLAAAEDVYQRALSLNPQNEAAKEALKKLLDQKASGVLK